MKYFILDPARDGNGMHRFFEKGVLKKDCLYTDKDLAQESFAPFLFQLNEEAHLEFFRLINENWEDSWGSFIELRGTYENALRHLRGLTDARIQNGHKVYFRYYDPRVLRIFLPTCSSQQIIEFFGPVSRFICVDEDPKFAVVFENKQGSLITDRVPTESIFPKIPQDVEEEIFDESLKTKPVMDDEKEMLAKENSDSVEPEEQSEVGAKKKKRRFNFLK